MLGYAYSTSRNCGMVRFIGGPYDGQSGLYDHNDFDGIGFSSYEDKCSHEYVPKDKGRSWDYIFKGTYYWRQLAT